MCPNSQNPWETPILRLITTVSKDRFLTKTLSPLQNFLADEHDRATAGAGQPRISLDALDGEARYALEPVNEVSPDKLFERRWATTVLAQQYPAAV